MDIKVSPRLRRTLYPFVRSFPRIARLLVPIAVLILAGCGGADPAGQSSQSSQGSVPPPSALSYPAPGPFTVGQAITALSPSVSGMVSNYTISPTLPRGLGLDTSTGVILGTPTAVTPLATYTVTAANASGATSAQLTIVVNDVAPSITYPVPAYSFTSGVAAQTITPTVAGGAIINWSVAPPLPAGLTLGATDGTISGTPTSGATAANYVITAENSGGQSTVTLRLAVSSAPLLDLGHASPIGVLRFSGSAVLSLDTAEHWALWNFSSGAMLSSGNASCATIPCPQKPQYVPAYAAADLAGTTVAVQTATGLETHSALDGHLLAQIPATLAWWRLASDGSYVCGGSKTGLTAWSPSGQVLFSRPGDYSTAVAFAAPAAVQVALGPAGVNVIETIAVASGDAVSSPTFQGQFNSWFLDGDRFLTNTGTTVWVYSTSAVQQELISLPATLLGGQGDWFWTLDTSGAPTLAVYSVGGGAQAAATFTYSSTLNDVIASNQSIAALDSDDGSVSVIDLSGATPIQTAYTAPIGYLSAYASQSSKTWIVGNQSGLLLDGTSLSSLNPRYLDYGSALAVAGGGNRVAIATASGQILYFDTATDAQEGSIAALSSLLQMSADGTVLAAAFPNPTYVNYDAISIYSLPSGSQSATYPFSSGGLPTLINMWLAGSGTVLGEYFTNDPSCGPTCQTTAQAVSVANGAPIWTDASGLTSQMQFSPDGALIAASGGPGSNAASNILQNGSLVTAVSGWPLGWIDDNHLLTNTYTIGSRGTVGYSGSTIYDSQGNKTASLLFPKDIEIMQPVTANTIYAPKVNTMFSLQTGSPTWTSASPAILNGGFTATVLGAVAGQQVVFESGNFILAEPY